ncbi:polysaccharide pyruvyl transferase family protein [Terrisporobacter hibernicus]|uniref:Polysaccharide pyruvyl transferase family protein n=1 Tax=Terrisporobacter hibernicus TaxID=2813371 RepID=A0AAX2ZHF2_9FIRM|nr:polysaccharide pyruvyl transferase family protein [Terrisporobacter hibernicus]UEL48758.1 polysaccharide pyruvyl transferase family protein [Terrisporobacter hibernicus]
MRICTLTCHDVYNHGASIQAYALMKYLKNIGHEVEIIDYKPDYLSQHYDIWGISNPKWKKNILTKVIYITLKMPGRLISLKRKKAFDKFREKNLIITQKRYTSNEELKKDLPQADVYICGSDQIWNSLHRNGKDPAFYLDFVPDNKIKVAYAASFATDTIDDKYKPMVKKKVLKLDGVGIREKSGVEIVKGLGIDKAINVVDPVFLLDKEEWNKIGNETFNDNYILVYDFDKSSLVEKIATEIAREKGLKIYTINEDKPKYANRHFNLSGPNTFVSLVKNAEFVISNSFHAVVFSVIYNKNIAIVNRTENINTRMKDLLDDLKLKNRLVNENYKIEQILKDIDYTESNKILNQKIDFSKQYIDNILSAKNTI